MFIKEKPFYQRFFHLTGMIALQNLIVLGVNLCDNLMLGRYSDTAMSGMSLVNQIQFLLLQILMGIGSGASVIASQYWGKGKETQAIRRVFSIAFCAALGVGVAFGIGGFFFPEQLLRLLTPDAAIISEGAVFLKTLAPVYPLLALTQVGIAMFRSVESPQIGVYLSFATLVIDAGLNYVLIYGKFGFPELGIRGAAIATLISYVVQFFMILLYLRVFDKKLQLRLRQLFSPKKAYLKKYLKTALPLIGSTCSWGLAMFFQTAILGRLEPLQSVVAANSIAVVLFQFVTVIIYAAATTSHIMVGKAVGEGDIPRVKAYVRTMQVLFLGLGVCTSLALFLLRDWIVDFYRIPPETRALALQFLSVLTITSIGTSYQMSCLAGIVSGGGDTGFVLRNDFIFQWCIVLPLSLLAAFVWQLPPIWVFALLKSDQITKCFVAVVKVNRFRWIRHLTHEESPHQTPENSTA